MSEQNLWFMRLGKDGDLRAFDNHHKEVYERYKLISISYDIDCDLRKIENVLDYLKDHEGETQIKQFCELHDESLNMQEGDKVLLFNPGEDKSQNEYEFVRVVSRYMPLKEMVKVRTQEIEFLPVRCVSEPIKKILGQDRDTAKNLFDGHWKSIQRVDSKDRKRLFLQLLGK